MGKGKLWKWEENAEMTNVFAPDLQEAVRVAQPPHKGHWHTEVFGTCHPITFELCCGQGVYLSLLHLSAPTRRTPLSSAVFCLKKTKGEEGRRREGDREEVEEEGMKKKLSHQKKKHTAHDIDECHPSDAPDAAAAADEPPAQSSSLLLFLYLLLCVLFCLLRSHCLLRLAHVVHFPFSPVLDFFPLLFSL